MACISPFYGSGRKEKDRHRFNSGSSPVRLFRILLFVRSISSACLVCISLWNLAGRGAGKR